MPSEQTRARSAAVVGGALRKKSNDPLAAPARSRAGAIPEGDAKATAEKRRQIDRRVRRRTPHPERGSIEGESASVPRARQSDRRSLRAILHGLARRADGFSRYPSLRMYLRRAAAVSLESDGPQPRVLHKRRLISSGGSYACFATRFSQRRRCGDCGWNRRGGRTGGRRCTALRDRLDRKGQSDEGGRTGVVPLSQRPLAGACDLE